MRDADMGSSRFFVTGTDTGIGKTVVSLLLMQLLSAKGAPPFYIKLVQTGCGDLNDDESDAAFIYRNAPGPDGARPCDAVPYHFKSPKAPYFAARDEGERIDVRIIEEFVRSKGLHHPHLVLEGSGGLFVPVDERVLMIDMIGRLNARPIVVARAGLGTINHSMLSLDALRARKIECCGVVLVDPGRITTSNEMIEENIEAIEKLSGAPVAGVIGRIDDFSNPPEAAFEPLLRILDRLGIAGGPVAPVA